MILESVALIKATQLILSLALLIILHEGGHFLAAKMFGIRVEKFFLFFDYKFHILSTKDKWVQRLFPRVKDWETEYGIGWIPLGGYVKIAGMVDESMDMEQLKQPVQQWEFRAKRPWQRLIVMLGGVIVNVLTAIAIYIGVMWAWGTQTVPMDGNFSQGFYYSQSALDMGFQQGDKLLRIDSVEVEEWNYGQIMLDLAEAATATVEREGCEVVVTLPEEFPLLTLLKEQPRFIAPYVEAIIDSVVPGSPAEQAGITKWTRLMAIDDAEGVLTDICSWNRFNELMARRYDVLAAKGCTAADSARMRRMVVQFLLPGDSVCSTAEMTLDDEYLFGFLQHSWMSDVVFEHRDYTFTEALPAGCTQCWETLASYVGQFKYLFSKEGAQSVGSFATIGDMFPATWDWATFWAITAFISIILAFMNVLPIPGLDGGHAFFTIIEMITGYTFSEKFQERAITVGFSLILALMALALYNDAVRYIF